ncbi:MAG: glycosyltransferase family 2 protein [Nitrospirae bacterium]|nr:MAG: glycosyltransferase family 2 protein [Nitrospirota bacterium]
MNEQSMNTKNKTGVVLVNWNGVELTVPCIASLLEGTVRPDQIVVVDNASEDGSADLIARQFPEVELIRNKENLGFTGANNIGISSLMASGCGYIWILNNDTTVDDRCLEVLKGHLDAHPEVAACSGKILHDEPRNLVWYAGATYNPWTVRTRHRGHGEQDTGQYESIEKVPFISGCCMFVRSEAITNVGPFDDHFFAYDEDSDWCLRAAKAGLRLEYLPGAVIRHKVSASVAKLKKQEYGGDTSLFAVYVTSRNRLFLIRKHAAGLLHACTAFSVFFLWALYYGAALMLLGRIKKFKALAMSVYDGILQPLDDGGPVSRRTCLIQSESQLMDDQQLILGNLVNSGRSGALDRPWVLRWYILAFCFAPAVMILIMSARAEEARAVVLAGQFALAAGTCLALCQLCSKPLINPIQAVVFLFHWWFAVGPASAVLFAVLRDDADLLGKYVGAGGASLWVVALGLPLYAYSAKKTMQWSRDRIRHLSFLMPEGPLYRPAALYAYWLLGGVLAVTVIVLGQFGIVGRQAISYLGATISENWFVSVLEAISTISVFATVGVMAYLIGPVRQGTGKFKAIAVGLILFNTVTAFTSGWKGAIVQSFVLLFIVMYVWRQKLPILLVVMLALSYLFVVEPFVRETRIVAEITQISTPEERYELFKAAMGEATLDDLAAIELNIESPFRYIFEYAEIIASESSLFNGPWSGTISDGLLALVPRALYPDKPEGTVGNFFARYLGNAAPDDYEQNIGVSLPFEIVGNYGYIMGVLSFIGIGVLWTLFCVWLLSEARLATHPLAPLCIMYALSMEASIGQFLARFRDLPLLLVAAYLLWLLLRKRI